MVTATFNATSLAPGVYTDTITVTAAEATNSPLTIPVTFTVLNSDMIVTSPNGSEQWVKGETRSVTWISSLGGNAKIELFKGGVLNSTIVASTPNTGSYSWVIPGAQAAAADYTVKITSIETPAKTDSSNANFSIFPTLADALDATSLTWTTSGNQPWVPQITTSQDGVDAAQSGTIGDSQSSSVETTLTGPGTLTYWWKISSELNYDYLKFYLNGIEQTGSLAKISGEIAWIQKTVTIPTGSQTIKWTYSKDGSAASGSDAAWVDGVVFTPASSPEIAVEQPVGTDLTDGGADINFGSVSLGSSSSPSTFTIRNTGTANLTGIAVTKTGTHNADYAIGALGATTLAPGASTTFTVTFTPGGSGSRVAALQIASNDANENPFDINLAGTGVPLGTLDVSSGGLASTGTYGGSFSPPSKIYTLTNVGSTSINWTAGTTQGWVTLSAASGTLAAGATTTVTTSINANANTLAPNSYTDTVTFTNTTNGFGNATRAVDLTVNALSATVDLSNLQQTYNGSPRPVTVTTTPFGLAHSVTYNGSSTVPTIGGTYAVVATITEPNYAGSASGNLVISYTVSYQANGNTGGTAPADQAKYQDVNLALATNSGNLNKTDYSLISWNTAADGSGTDYALGGTYSSNASLVLYAKWAPGADGTWVQTTAGPFDWSTSGNWSGGTIAAGADRTANFTANITAAQVVNLDSARTIGNITFTDSTTASHDLTISGANPLTLARTTGMPTINVTNRTLTISSQISGNGGLKKAGAGNLTLSGTNDYTGGTVISAGTLAIALDSNLGAASGGIIFDGTSSLSLGVTTLAAGRTITINNGVTATFTQGTNGQKTVLGSLTGAGTLVFNTTTGLSFQNASNSFSGVINATTGNTLSYGLEFASIGDGVGAGLINLNNGSFRWINTSGGATTLSNRQFALSGTTSGGTISALGNTGSILAITKDLLVTGDGNKTFTLAGTNTGANRFAGNISNGSVGGTTDIISLTKSEAGTWALSGTNTYSGDTNLVASGTTGRLVFQGSQSLSPNTKLVFAQASSNVQSARFLDDGVGTINFARPIEFGGTNTSQSLNLFVGNNSTANLGSSLGTTTGSTIQVGNITFTSTAADTATTTINVTGTNNYRLQTGIITLNNLVTRTANNTTVTAINPTTANMTVAAITMATGNTGTVNDGIPVVRLDGTSTDNVVTGVISNATDYLSGQALSLQKQNTSTWTLSGANAYTGTTTVTAGKLFINGDQSLATGNVSVASAATLGGSGKIGGSVTIATGGKLEFDISTSAAGHNPLDISSGKDFIFSGTSTLTITSSVSLAAGTYTLITGGNSITGVAPATLNVSVPVGAVASTYISGNSLMLKIVGPIDHFAISPISSPRTVNTLITGITITAQDTANQTIASFNGTVSFGGTAGVTGTSASFVNGVLSGVSITPSVLGDNRTFTVNDGSGHVGMATFNVQSAAYSGWVSTGVSQFQNTFTDTALTSNPDGDSLTNLQEFAFGSDPTSSTTSTLGFAMNGEVTQPGVPVMMNFAATGQPAEYRAVFARRKDHVAANVAYTVVFSADLQVWTASSTNLNVVTNSASLGELEAVSIPFPTTVPVQGGGAQQAPKFFRVGVAGN